MKLKYIILTFAVLIITANVFSIQIKKSEAPVTETANFNEDYIFAGNSLNFSGQVDDLIFAGENLTFSGKTNSSLFAVGKKIALNGNIDNNLYCAGNNVEINGTINDNIFMAGESIIINKESVVNGTIFTVGRNIIITGEINGNLLIAGGNLTIDGTINGDIKAVVGNIIITDNGSVAGDFDYKSDNKISDEEKSRINGSVYFKELKHPHEKDIKNFRESFKILAFIIFKIFVLISFIIGGLLILLFPINKKLEEERTAKNFWFSSLWGLIPFLIYPVVIILLIGLGITFPLGIFLALAGLPILFLTKVFGVTMFGQYLFKTFKWNTNKRFLYFLFGLIFYSILFLIPGIGFLAMIFFSSLGWGYILEKLFNRKLSD